MAHIESWKNNKTLISQEDYEKLDETEKGGKYSLGEIESYFILFESLLAPKSNPLLAVKELHFVKQGSLNSGEFHSHVTKIAKRCQFPNAQAEERAIRDAIFLGMNSQKARDKAINLMNEEGKVLTVDFLMNQLETEDYKSHHKMGKAERTEEMERSGQRINLESRDLLILDIILENPQGWRESA